MHNQVVAFLKKYHFIRAEWSNVLTCFTHEEEPRTAYDYVAGTDLDKEWTALSIALEKTYGVYPHSMRREFYAEA